jgi:hypothetical protein
MKMFRFTADAYFEAEDIDDAFLKLRDHFASFEEDASASSLDFKGQMEIKPTEQADKEEGS